jgi:hypothetical protein
MIIIDIIVYRRKRKTCIIFRRKINGMLLDGFGKILIGINVFWKEKKMCIIFGKK